MSISISSHVLNLGNGEPAAGLRVRLHDANGSMLAEASTNADGRITDWGVPLQLRTGRYQMVFEVADWYAARGEDCFYPSVSVDFIAGTERHYHVPLLLNRYGYSTYRGS